MNGMNIREYIESGILELYCLGSLSTAEEAEVRLAAATHSGIAEEIERIQLALEEYSAIHAVAPPDHLADAISDIFDNCEKEARMDMEDLPLINKFSNHQTWMPLVPKTIPATINEERYCQVLTNTAALMQMLVISTTDFEDEVHDDLMESFLILQGACECTVENEVRQMKAGDYMEIPLYAHHDVKMQSPFVVAILQRRAI